MEVVVAYFNTDLLSQHVHGETERNHYFHYHFPIIITAAEL